MHERMRRVIIGVCRPAQREEVWPEAAWWGRRKLPLVLLRSTEYTTGVCAERGLLQDRVFHVVRNCHGVYRG
jgi:hypothetical protein